MKMNNKEYLIRNLDRSSEADALAMFCLAEPKKTLWQKCLLTKIKEKEKYQGFGLNYRWDAFRDGNINTSNCLYTYTTCWAGIALATTPFDYGGTLIDKIGYFRDKDGICFCYDDETIKDENYKVANINALAAMYLDILYQRDGNERYKYYSEEALKWILNTQKESGNWNYAQWKDRENDPVHFGFILEALYYFDKEEEFNKGLKELKRINKNKVKGYNGSHDWGVGESLYIARLCEDKELEKICLEELEQNYNGEYFYSGNIRGNSFIYRGIKCKNKS